MVVVDASVEPVVMAAIVLMHDGMVHQGGGAVLTGQNLTVSTWLPFPKSVGAP